MRRRELMLSGVAACLALPARAQTGYPQRVVKLVVPFASGGGFDAIARPFADRLSKRLGQPVIVENRPGAGGNLGSELVARAPADGYTILFANSSLVTQRLVQKNSSFDPLKDLVAVGRVGAVSTAMAIHPARDAKDLRQLIELSHRKQLTYGTPGIGTAPHLVGELLRQRGTMNLLHVAYKGTGPAITDAIGGQIDMVMVPASALANVIRAGKLRGIAVLSTARSPILPDLPTLREHGLPEVHGETWYGMFAPTGTPPAIVNTLSAAAAEVLAQPDLVQILRTAGYEPGASTPAELAETVKADNARWGRVIAEAGIRLEQ